MGGGRREGAGRIRLPQCQRTDLLFRAGYPRGRVGWRWVQGRQKGGRLHSSARATVRAAGERRRRRACSPRRSHNADRSRHAALGRSADGKEAADTVSFFSCPLKVSRGIQQPPSLRSLEAVRATSADNKKTKSRAYCFLVRCSATPSDWADDAERSHRREWQRPVRASGRPGAKAAGPCLVRPRVALRPDEALEEYGHHGPSRRSHHHSIIRHHNTSLASLPSENTHRALQCAGVANTGATAAP